MKRGDVFWADLVPRSGSEQTGRRPVIVLSHDGFNQIAASQGARGPTVVALPGGSAGLTKESFAICHQVTTLDRAKLTRRVGTLPSDLLRSVEEALKAAMDLD
jgi:mRNA interferase MazF